MTDQPVKCRHRRISGDYCPLCKDVVPTLYGWRPWWAPLAKFHYAHWWFMPLLNTLSIVFGFMLWEMFKR